jgi:hypothetical protein
MAGAGGGGAVAATGAGAGAGGGGGLEFDEQPAMPTAAVTQTTKPSVRLIM